MYVVQESLLAVLLGARLLFQRMPANKAGEQLLFRHATAACWFSCRPPFFTRILPSCRLGCACVCPRENSVLLLLCVPSALFLPARVCGAQGTVQQLANGDLLRPLRVECWDYDRAGGHDFIGGCAASIADMQV